MKYKRMNFLTYTHFQLFHATFLFAIARMLGFDNALHRLSLQNILREFCKVGGAGWVHRSKTGANWVQL